MKYLKTKIRKWLGLDTIEYDIDQMKKNIDDAVDVIRDRTTVNIDHYPHGCDPNRVVIIGRHKNTDYVQIFDLNTRDFGEIVEILKSLTKYSKMGIIDSTPTCKQIFERKIERGGKT